MRVMSDDKCQMTKGAGLVNLTPQDVDRLLGLREGMRVTGASWEPLAHCLQVRVDGPGLPVVREGMLPVIVSVEDVR